MRLAPLVVAFAGLLPCLSAQQTWTVAAAGGAQFTDIGAAVAAAASGDAILVGPGAYVPFVVDGKALVLIGDGATVAQVHNNNNPVPPSIEIANLAVGQLVQMVGISVSHFGPAPAALQVRNCAGTVWVQDAFLDSFAAPAVAVEQCADVVLVECTGQTSRGGVTRNGVPLAFPGAMLVGSSVRIVGGEYRGSSGVLAGPGVPAVTSAAPGGDALLAVDSQVWLVGGGYFGGTGGFFWNGTCSVGGDGGDAIQLDTAGGTPSLVRAVTPNLQEGSPGFPSSCGAASFGLPVRMLAGSFVLDAGHERLVRCPASLVGPALAGVEVLGRAGDFAVVCAGLPAPTVAVLGLPLSLAGGANLVTLGVVPIGSTGRATLSVPVPQLGPNVPDLQLAVQALVLDFAARASATNPRTLLLR